MASTALRLSTRDPRAFVAFYQEHAVGLTRFFVRQVADPDAALDLVAETFAQAYAGRRGFRGGTDEEARAWLYVIARRQLAGYLRRGYADRTMQQRLGLERPVADAEELRRVEELGAMDELREWLVVGMQELPEGYREAVRLRVVEELPYLEVARMLAITETAARMRVSRALSRLRAAVPADVATGGLS
jgi:RNA polymerase sigma-70 factor (ECF subfamily)